MLVESSILIESSGGKDRQGLKLRMTTEYSTRIAVFKLLRHT